MKHNLLTGNYSDSMKLLGNIIWILFGGLWLALSWWITAIIMIVFIVTIPWAKAAFELGTFSLMPFGKTVIDRSEISGKKDIGTGTLGTIGNVIWLLLAGIWLAIANLILGALFSITIIGIPFGVQCFKLAKASLMPIGKQVVDINVKEAIQGK